MSRDVSRKRHRLRSRDVTKLFTGNQHEVLDCHGDDTQRSRNMAVGSAVCTQQRRETAGGTSATYSRTPQVGVATWHHSVHK